MYFNYHAKAQNLIKTGHLIAIKFVDKWNNVENAMVLFFDNHKPMPIRNYKIPQYITILQNYNIDINKLLI